jgi:predicted branched-subunit amino acid permease
MDTTNDEKEYAVIKFIADEKYATCSQRYKTNNSAGYFIGEEVTIQWSKHEVYKGIVVYTDGKNVESFCFSTFIDCTNIV